MTKSKIINLKTYKYRESVYLDMINLEKKLFDLLDQMRIGEVKRAEGDGKPYHIHGLCAVLGYDPKKHASYFEMEVGRDILSYKEVYLHDPEALKVLEEAMEIDGAILIGSDGKLLHSGRYMEADRKYKRDERVSATYQKLRETADAGTRHLAAIALSAQLEDLSFYTLKSDHPQLRQFKRGSIYRSTVPGEGRYDPPVTYQAIPEF